MTKYFTSGMMVFSLLALVSCTFSQEAPSLNLPDEEEPRNVQQEEAIEKQPVTQKTSTIEQKIQCQSYGSENYEDMYMDDGWITFEYYYSPVLDTCILQREEMGPEPDMLVFKLYDMFTKEILLHYSTFQGIGCAVAKECVDTMAEYNERKGVLLGM